MSVNSIAANQIVPDGSGSDATLAFITIKDLVGRLTAVNGSLKGSDGQSACFLADTSSDIDRVALDPRMNELLTSLERNRSIEGKLGDELIKLLEETPGLKRGEYRAHSTIARELSVTGTMIGLDPHITARFNFWSEVINSLNQDPKIKTSNPLIEYFDQEITNKSSDPNFAFAVTKLFDLSTKKHSLEEQNQDWSIHGNDAVFNDPKELSSTEQVELRSSYETIFNNYTIPNLDSSSAKEIVGNLFSDLVSKFEKFFLDGFDNNPRFPTKVDRFDAIKPGTRLLLELESSGLLLSSKETRLLETNLRNEFIDPAISNLLSTEYLDYITQVLKNHLLSYARNDYLLDYAELHPAIATTSPSPATVMSSMGDQATSSSSGSTPTTKLSVNLSTQELLNQALSSATQREPNNGLLFPDVIRHRKIVEAFERGVIEEELSTLLQKNHDSVESYIQANGITRESLQHDLRETALQAFIHNDWRSDKPADEAEALKQVAQEVFQHYFPGAIKKSFWTPAKVWATAIPLSGFLGFASTYLNPLLELTRPTLPDPGPRVVNVQPAEIQPTPTQENPTRQKAIDLAQPANALKPANSSELQYTPGSNQHINSDKPLIRTNRTLTYADGYNVTLKFVHEKANDPKAEKLLNKLLEYCQTLAAPGYKPIGTDLKVTNATLGKTTIVYLDTDNITNEALERIFQESVIETKNTGLITMAKFANGQVAICFSNKFTPEFLEAHGAAAEFRNAVAGKESLIHK